MADGRTRPRVDLLTRYHISYYLSIHRTVLDQPDLCHIARSHCLSAYLAPTFTVAHQLVEGLSRSAQWDIVGDRVCSGKTEDLWLVCGAPRAPLVVLDRGHHTTPYKSPATVRGTAHLPYYVLIAASAALGRTPDLSPFAR